MRKRTRAMFHLFAGGMMFWGTASAQTLTVMAKSGKGAEKAGFPLAAIIIAGCVILLVLIIALVIFLIWKKSHDVVEFESIDESILKNMQEADVLRQERAVHGVDAGGKDAVRRSQGVGRQLVLADVHNPLHTYQVPFHKPVLVGRSREECNIALEFEKSVSGRHCEIYERGGRYYVNDLQSSNGTYVNRNRVMGEAEIVPGSILTLGRLEMHFDVK